MTTPQPFRFALLVLFCASAAGAEVTQVERPAVAQTWPIDVSVQAGSLGFFPQDLSPSFTFGTEYAVSRGPIYELALAPGLGLVFFRENMLGGLFELAALNRWRSRFGFYAEATLGAGYQLTFFPGATYVARDGAFVAGGNDPKSVLRARISVGLGFDFASLGWRPLRVSAQYSAFVLTPYAVNNGIPVMPGAQVVIGLSVPLDVDGGRSR